MNDLLPLFVQFTALVPSVSSVVNPFLRLQFREVYLQITRCEVRIGRKLYLYVNKLIQKTFVLLWV